MEDFIECLKKYSDDCFVDCDGDWGRSSRRYYIRFGMSGWLGEEVYYDAHEKGSFDTGYRMKLHVNRKESRYKIMKGRSYTGYDLIDKTHDGKYYLYYNGERYQKPSSDSDSNGSLSDFQPKTQEGTDNSASSGMSGGRKKGISIGTVVLIIVAVIVFLHYCSG